MQEYCKELETLIIDTLLPAYLEHARLTGRKDALKNINSNLLDAMRKKRKVPYLLQKQSYDRWI